MSSTRKLLMTLAGEVDKLPNSDAHRDRHQEHNRGKHLSTRLQVAEEAALCHNVEEEATFHQEVEVDL